MRRIIPIAVCLLFGLCTLVSGQELSVPVVISDNMVLQQGNQVNIWGKAAPGRKVSVSFDGTCVRLPLQKGVSVQLACQLYHLR